MAGIFALILRTILENVRELPVCIKGDLESIDVENVEFHEVPVMIIDIMKTLFS
jgi:hypothetical protein